LVLLAKLLPILGVKNCFMLMDPANYNSFTAFLN